MMNSKASGGFVGKQVITTFLVKVAKKTIQGETRMKRTGFVTAVLLVFTALAVFAQTGNDFEITQNRSGGITITGYTGTINDVVIPATIEGIKVTEITGYRSTFYNEPLFGSRITSVIIPNGVTRIGPSTFYYGENLTSVTIPNSVISIEDGAFSGCRRLASVTIPNSVKTIGDRAFWLGEGTGLISVTIGNGVTSIGKGAFFGNEITSITIGANLNCTDVGFPNNFAAFYDSQGRKAGTYIWTGRLWRVGTAAEAEQARKDAKAEQMRKDAEAEAKRPKPVAPPLPPPPPPPPPPEDPPYSPPARTPRETQGSPRSIGSH